MRDAPVLRLTAELAVELELIGSRGKGRDRANMAIAFGNTSGLGLPTCLRPRRRVRRIELRCNPEKRKAARTRKRICNTILHTLHIPGLEEQPLLRAIAQDILSIKKSKRPR